MRNLRLALHVGLVLLFLEMAGYTAYQPDRSAARGSIQPADTLYVDGIIGTDVCTNYDPSTRSCGSGGSIAYQDIAGATAVVQPGDTVLIQPGIYTGGITVDTSGTAGAPITFQANGAGVVIEGSGGVEDAFFITYAQYITVDGLTIRHANRAGIRIDNSHHVTVRNCLFADNETWGLFTDFSDYTTVEDSEAYGSVEQHGIYISNSSDYPTIRGNRLYNNYGCGLHMNGDISMGGDGIISHAVVENNIVYGNGAGGGSGINMDGVTDSIVRNNLLYDNHASGISLYQDDGGSASKNNRVINNTVLMPANGRWALNIRDTENNLLYNNIVLNNHSYRGSILIGPVLAGFESDYNVVVDRFANDGEGDTILTLAEWQALGYDQHSFIGNTGQLFEDAAADNYHLAAGSPAIDHGTPLGDVLTDLEGHPRPIGAGYDIGAYEFQPLLVLSGVAGDHTITLAWEVNVTLPLTTTWSITYTGPPGDQPSPIVDLLADTRTYTLTGLTNSMWYGVKLTTVGPIPVLSGSLSLMPNDRQIYLPIVRR